MTRISILVMMLSAGSASLHAQAFSTVEPNYESRAGLEAKARAAENGNRAAEAGVMRARLRTGDFQDGDRIVVVLESNPAATDTMQVRAGRMLQFQRMSEVSLEGVLRSELNGTLRRHLSKYLTNPEVRATPLLPLAVLGSVRNPGFFYSPADYLLRDLVMRAGGPAPEADVSRTEVRRAGKTIWSVKQVRSAFMEGLSLDRLHLQAGDEVFVPAKKNRTQLTTTLLAVVSTVTVTLAVLQRH